MGILATYQLAGKLPVLNLPTNRPRPPVQTYRGASIPFKLSADLTQKLKALGRAHKATLSMTLLAAFQVLLYRYTGQEDLLVGSPTAGRSRADLAGMVGYFVNPVVLRADLSRNPTLSAFLGQVRSSVLDVFEHQDYPFALLVERLQPLRDPNRSPLFQTMFVLEKAHLQEREGLASFTLGETGTRMTLGELELESFALEQRVAQFDLMMAEVDGGLAALFEYNTDLFDATTITRMVDHFQTLLKGFVTNPEQHLSDLPLGISGKVDRCVLPVPDRARPEWEKAYVAPRTPVEKVLAGIWAQVLALEQVGIHDNFFEIGGHSLLATQVISRVHDTLHVELPLHIVFEATTVAKLSQVAIANETKPGQTEKIAQVLEKIEQVLKTIEAMSKEVRETLQQKNRERGDA